MGSAFGPKKRDIRVARRFSGFLAGETAAAAATGPRAGAGCERECR